MSTYSIIKTVLLILISYFSFFLLLNKSAFGRNLLRQFHAKFNKEYANYFKDIRMVAQAMDGKPYVSGGEFRFTLQGVQPVKNFDTKFTLINIKSVVSNDPGELGKPPEEKQAGRGSYKFSFWHFFLLPISLLSSLWLGFYSLLKPGVKWILGSYIFLLVLLYIEFKCTLLNMRINASFLEPMSLSGTEFSLIQYINSLHLVEMIYVKVLLLFVLANLKSLKDIYLKMGLVKI